MTPQKIERSRGIDPVPARLRVLCGLDTGLLWGNLGVSLVIVAAAALVPAFSLPDAQSFLLLLGSVFVPLFAVLLVDWLSVGRHYSCSDVFGTPAA